MKRLDFNKLECSNSIYGKKNIDTAFKSTSENKGLLEIVRILASW